NGLTFDYGLQYFTSINDDLGLAIGYSGNAGKAIRSKASQVATRTFGNAANPEENIALDTIKTLTFEDARKTVVMPMLHKIGFSFNKRNKWLIGADFNYGKWGDFK